MMPGNRSGNSFADGEVLSFPLVGARHYVRAVDVIALIEQRIPDFRTVQARFLRPLSGGAVINLGRRAGAAVSVRVVGDTGDTFEFALANRYPAETLRIDEAPLHPHWVVPSGSGPCRCAIVGRPSAAAVLAVAFAAFQRRVGRRFVLRSLQLDGLVGHGAELVTVIGDPPDSGQGARCTITRNGRSWCRVDMVAAPAADRVQAAVRNPSTSSAWSRVISEGG